MTNDDKDLKPCPFCEVIVESRTLFAKKHVFHPKNECWISQKWIPLEQWNSRSTPQQPSEPLKEFDGEYSDLGKVVYLQALKGKDMKICGRQYSCQQPSEKKALSVQDVENIMHNCLSAYEINKFIKIQAEAIHSALPAQREVRYPEKVKVPHDGKFGGVSFERIKAIERNDTIDEFKKLNGG